MISAVVVVAASEKPADAIVADTARAAASGSAADGAAAVDQSVGDADVAANLLTEALDDRGDNREYSCRPFVAVRVAELGRRPA